MILIEASIRGGVIALILVLGALAARGAARSAVDRYSALYTVLILAYLIESAPALARSRADWVCAIRLVSILNPAMFWLWVKAQMDDPFVPSWRNWLPFAGLGALGAWALAANQALPWHAVQYASLLLVGLGVWRALSGRGGDLIEKRRRLRLVLAIGAAAYIVALQFIAMAALNAHNLVAAIGLESALGVFVAFGIGLRVTREPLVAPAQIPSPELRPVPPPDPEEARLLEALRRTMEVEKVYREERCDIASLAARLGIPEYRLRRLINQRLGHRNFTSYVNGYRLAEIMAALADPSQAEVPILTIAMDAGFQSLGPFNRAFKEKTGMTPSEYRRARFGEPEAATPPNGSPIPKSASA
ncbi:MAG: AraC family transcriptional regulator [Alphaproteobacteria bacterium]|nr:AraC family transcriptional regulator [Alphaproteobacteria bacterium]